SNISRRKSDGAATQAAHILRLEESVDSLRTHATGESMSVRIAAVRVATVKMEISVSKTEFTFSVELFNETVERNIKSSHNGRGCRIRREAFRQARLGRCTLPSGFARNPFTELLKK